LLICRLKTTNLSAGTDHHGVRPGPDHVVKPPPTLVRNHLHGSDMFIRNQLETVSPPKFQRSMTPSPSYTDSDYFSTSSRGTPPHISPDLVRNHGVTHEVTHPTLQHTDNHHTRSSSYQFSLPRPANSASNRSRARRRHSSIEFSAQPDSRSDDGHRSSIPSRPQSSTSNVQDSKVISDRLNRHQSYYEAVNNEVVTSQTIFSHSTEIRPVIEETNSPADLEPAIPSSDEVCTNGIDLEMMGSQEEHNYVFMYHTNGEVTTTFPRQSTNEQQSSPPSARQSDGAHPRLLNSTGSPLPLQSISPKPYQRTIPVKYSPPHHHYQQPRHLSNSDVMRERPPR